MKTVKATPFGARLLQAFAGSTKAEIARALEVGSSTVTDYIKGSSKPTADGLVRIAEITKCNLHWLLTGEGESSSDPFKFLRPGIRSIIERLAKDEKKSADEIIARLLSDALVSRGAELFALNNNLREREREQLRLIFQEFYMATDAEQDEATGSAAPSRRQAS